MYNQELEAPSPICTMKNCYESIHTIAKHSMQVLFTTVIMRSMELQATPANAPINNCNTNQNLSCLHGGSCKLKSKASPLHYKCLCPFSHCGRRCQAPNPCYKKKLCFHAGRCRCLDKNLDYYCACFKPFSGRHCEDIPDIYNPCFYPNNCPQNTTCEPAMVQHWDKERKKQKPYSLAYHCKTASNLYFLRNQIPHESLSRAPKKKCGPKRPCDKGEECLKDRCEEVPKHDSFAAATPRTLNRLDDNHSNSICGVNVLDRWSARFDQMTGVVNIGENDVIAGSKDEFDDINTSSVDTKDIDAIIFGEVGRTRQHRTEQVHNHLDRGGQVLGMVRHGSKQRRQSNKTGAGYNPCRHEAKCIPDKMKGYRCLCLKGTSGKNCSQGCPEGKFNPPDCEKLCGQCSSRVCNYRSGSCDGNCSPGWRGRLCKVRAGLTVFMQMKLAGPFHDGFSSRSSPQYKSIQLPMTNWITSICASYLTLPCSVFNVKLSKGSVKVEYEVLFSGDTIAASSTTDISKKLVQSLMERIDKFNSTVYKVVRESLKVTSINLDASMKVGSFRQTWVMVVAMASGLLFLLTVCVSKVYITNTRRHRALRLVQA